MLAHASLHRYPRMAIVRSLILSGAGAMGALTIVAFGPENPFVSVICITILVVFLAYGGRTAIRGASVLILDETGLCVAGPWPRALAWSELTDLRLAYYTTRRDGENGWMELSVRSQRGRIALDSDIDGFAEIAARCRDAAEAAGLEIAPASSRNFDAALSSGFHNGQIRIRHADRREGWG